MKKTISLLVIALVCAALAIFFTAMRGVAPAPAPVATSTASLIASSTAGVPFPDSDYKHATVTIGGKSFDALMADTAALQEQGLSDRKGLAPDQVMLFSFAQPDRVGFWMKDMLFSLDMLFVGSDGKAVSMYEDLSPATYPQIYYPTEPAEYVVELPAGALAKLGVSDGDSVSIVR